MEQPFLYCMNIKAIDMVETERAKSPLARRREREGRVSRRGSTEPLANNNLAPQEPLPNTSIQDWTEQDMDDDFEPVPAQVLLNHPLSPCNEFDTEPIPAKSSPRFEFDLQCPDESPTPVEPRVNTEESTPESNRCMSPLARRREREGRVSRRPSASDQSTTAAPEAREVSPARSSINQWVDEELDEMRETNGNAAAEHPGVVEEAAAANSGAQGCAELSTVNLKQHTKATASVPPISRCPSASLCSSMMMPREVYDGEVVLFPLLLALLLLSPLLLALL